MTYNPNIPQPTDLISNSQAQILANFGQLNSQFGIDHTAFNPGSGNGDGFHKKVTLNIPLGADPSPAGTSSEVYSKDISGVAQLFFANSAGVQELSGFSTTASQNGSLAFPSGIVLKWGIFNMGAGVTHTGDITFAGGAFPNNYFSIVLSGTTSNSANTAGVDLAFTSTTRFQAFRSISPASNSSYFYIAIGN